MFHRLLVWPLLCGLVFPSAHALERNLWPFLVEESAPSGQLVHGEYVGPLLFKHAEDGATKHGFRPFYLKSTAGETETTAFLYPFFTWQKAPDYRYFTFFQLINFRRQRGVDLQTSRNFDIWPLYFSRAAADQESSYRAFFPVGGTIKQRFGYDKINFALFPLYAQTTKAGGRTTHAPWPFLRFIDGAGEHGFEFWPLFGQRGREGDYDSRFLLWPLMYKSAKKLSETEPEVSLGVLPFYTRDTKPGNRNENYLWPLFGYTDRTVPTTYHETRYLWPFLVQGRGEQHYVNRWGPFYTHSVVKGMDKRWVGWPIFRRAKWEDAGIAQQQTSVLFFLYWSLVQRSTTNPQAAPAHKTHLWPLYSSWDNGAGQRQLQLFSPFEVFFPTNDPVRQLYTPLLAIFRLDRRGPLETRGSVLFSLVSWKKSPVEKEFHLGPLFRRYQDSQQTRIQLGRGLLSWERRPETNRWRFSIFDFRSAPAASTSL